MRGNNSFDTALLVVAMGLNSLPYGYTLVVLPIYLHDLSFSGQIIGAVTAVSSIANTVALIPFAIAADRYGRKPFVVGGFLSATVAYLLFASTRDLNWLILASAIGGVGLAGGLSSAIWTPAWTALLTEKAGKRRTGAFAWSQGAWALALTVGSAMSVIPFFLRAQLGFSFGRSYEFMFLVLAGFAIASGAVLVPVHEIKDKAQNAVVNSGHWFRLRSRAQIARFSVTVGLVGFASGLAVQLLSFWFNRVYGASDAAVGPWFAAAEATSLIVVPIIPKLTKRFGSPRTVLLTQGVSSVFLMVMVIAPTYQIAGVLYVVRNFFMNISWPIQQSYLMGTVKSEERASASAITYTVWGVGSSVSPLLAGYLLSSSNFISISAPLSVGGAVYLASAMGFYIFFKNIAPPEEEAVTGKRRYTLPRLGLE